MTMAHLSTAESTSLTADNKTPAEKNNKNQYIIFKQKRFIAATHLSTTPQVFVLELASFESMRQNERWGLDEEKTSCGLYID